jgi:hypothetical protein
VPLHYRQHPSPAPLTSKAPLPIDIRVSTIMSTPNSGPISTYPPAASTASSASPATAQQLVESTSYRILYTGLGANICFYIGSVGFITFSSMELKNRGQDFVGENSTYLLGFGGYLLSGFVELYTDLRLTNNETRATTVPRSRYYNSESFVNILISALFILGNIFDVISFFLWHTKNWVLESNMLYVASYTWLATSMFILWASFFRPSAMVFSGNLEFRLDSMGNFLFFFGSVFDVIARHYSKPQKVQDRRVHWIELVAFSLWCLNAMCFLLADAVRLSMKEQMSLNNSKHRSAVDPDEA